VSPPSYILLYMIRKSLKGHENVCINYLEFAKFSEEEKSFIAGSKISS